jgi:hypothetical protein
VQSVIENSSAIRTEQVGPADRITAFVWEMPPRRRAVITAMPTVADHRCFRFADRQKVDRKGDRSDRLHRMFDFWGDGLGRARPHNYPELRLGASEKTQLPVVHHNPAPRAFGDTVSTTQAQWHGVLVPSRG